MTVLGLLTVVAVEAFRVGGRAWEKGERRAEEQQRLRILYATLARELASLELVVTTVDDKRLLGFMGKPDRLTFFAAPDGEGSPPLSIMVRGLAYFVETGRGLLLQESHPLVEGAVSFEPKETRVKVLEPRAQSVRFRYLVPDKEGDGAPKWADEWDPPEVPGRGPQAVRAVLDGLPLGVEVTILLSGGDSPTGAVPEPVTFYFPINVGRRLS